MRRLFGGLAGTLFLALALSTALGVLGTAALAWFVTQRALELRAALRSHGRKGLVVALRGASGRELIYPAVARRARPDPDRPDHLRAGTGPGAGRAVGRAAGQGQAGAGGDLAGERLKGAHLTY